MCVCVCAQTAHENHRLGVNRCQSGATHPHQVQLAILVECAIKRCSLIFYDCPCKSFVLSCCCCVKNTAIFGFDFSISSRNKNPSRPRVSNRIIYVVYTANGGNQAPLGLSAYGLCARLHSSHKLCDVFGYWYICDGIGRGTC